MLTNQRHIDQMGNLISIPNEPLRIVSIVPSQTELLYDLGLQDEVLGQTLFCIHPKEMHSLKPRIGGTKKLDIQKIRALKPNLIIGNKEENSQDQIEILMQEFPVWMSDIQNLDQALEMIVKLGHVVNKTEKAQEITAQLQSDFNGLVRTETPKKCLYLIWRKPWMAAGDNTFINDLLQRMGLQNAATGFSGRYPTISMEEIKRAEPDCIFLSSEPYPFKEKHIQELSEICPHAQIELVDGELFSWYGSRLLHSVKYLKTLQKRIF
ncbi:MAG: helical backbone metal receptor [Sphingobacteriales bacterium]|nr:helical backbone metal receptor [Sphingobacteriales bacterium]